MTDDELLVLYRSMRTLSEGMEARNAALEQSTAAQNAAIAQLRQLRPFSGGSSTSTSRTE